MHGLLMLYTRCITLTFRPYIWSANATKEQHTPTWGKASLGLLLLLQLVISLQALQIPDPQRLAAVPVLAVPCQQL